MDLRYGFVRSHVCFLLKQYVTQLCFKIPTHRFLLLLFLSQLAVFTQHDVRGGCHLSGTSDHSLTRWHLWTLAWEALHAYSRA